MGFLERIMGIQPAADLAQCEATIERGLAAYRKGLEAYRESGAALKVIRDGKLYRRVADTFEAYCRMRWQMEPQHANRLISASDVAENLGTTGSVPKNEATARPLAALKGADQLEAWAEAQQIAAPAEPTSKHVAAAVAKRRKPSAKNRPKTVRLKVPGAIVIVEPGRGFIGVEDSLFEALSKIGARVERLPIQDAA